MVELGQLEAHHGEFEQRNTQLIVVSLDDQETSRQTQELFPHLLVVSDADRNLSESVKVIHPHSSPEGGDSAAPTTILIDEQGTVRWTFRPDRYFRRLSPAQVLAAVDEHLPSK